MYLQQGELSRDKVFPMHPTSINGVEDMSTLAELHEAAIMYNLYLRYQKDCIYVRYCYSPTLPDRHYLLSSHLYTSDAADE